MNIYNATAGGNLVESTSGTVVANALEVTNLVHNYTSNLIMPLVPLSIRPKQGLVYPRNTE